MNLIFFGEDENLYRYDGKEVKPMAQKMSTVGKRAMEKITGNATDKPKVFDGEKVEIQAESVASYPEVQEQIGPGVAEVAIAVNAAFPEPPGTDSGGNVGIAEIAQAEKLAFAAKVMADADKEAVEMAVEEIRSAIEAGYEFTDAQRDIGIRMSLPCVPPPEREWFLEIAERILSIPLWQVLWGAYRRCHEWGMANAPLLDVGWEKGEFGHDYPERECEWCHQMFKPTDRIQDVCSNKCGGEKELHRLGLEKKKVEAQAVPTREEVDVYDQTAEEEGAGDPPKEKISAAQDPSIPDFPGSHQGN